MFLALELFTGSIHRWHSFLGDAMRRSWVGQELRPARCIGGKPQVRENINYVMHKTAENKIQDILDLIKMIGFLAEGQIIVLKHC